MSNLNRMMRSDGIGRIFTAKQRDPAADTRALERQIDQMVYALYGLTDAEIALVEGNG